MDPITAFASVITAITNVVTEIAKGQTAEQRKQLWDWYIADVARLRKLFKLDD